MKIAVLDGYTMNPGDLSWEGIERLGTTVIFDRTPSESIVEHAAGAGAVLTNKVPLREEAINALDALRYIGVTATGVDIIDLPAARARGITVTNVPAYGSDSVAQFTITLLLELCHQVGRHSDAVKNGAWCESKDWSFTLTSQTELADKTLGIIGFGRIGRRVGEIGHALGMKVLAFSRSQTNPPGYTPFAWASLDDLLRTADVVSLHCPLTPQTTGLINASRLALMKPRALLLNTSRGALVDAPALAEALNRGTIAGAALDVLSPEPPTADHPLLSAKNCILTPHMAWASREARERCMKMTVENLAAFIAGRPQNLVSG